MPLSAYEYLTRIGRLVQAEERASAGGLPPVQLHALDYLVRCNRYSDKPAAVGDYLQVTKGTASQTLLALERRGLIEKRSDAADRRIVRLRVTSRGRSLLRRAMPPPLVVTALDGLPAEQRRRIMGALDSFLRELQRVNQGRSFGVCHTCRHFVREGNERFRCGLTSDALSVDESTRICREHESAGVSNRKGASQ